MKQLLLAAAVLPLPYTLNLTGQAPFYAKQGLPTCLVVARQDLIRQMSIVTATCARDGGQLRQGKLTETVVQDTQCTAVIPLTCQSPDTPADATPTRELEDLPPKA